MTFDWLSRFRKPVAAGDVRGQHHPQRPPMAIARVHGKRPAPAPQVRPQVRRGHPRDQHQFAPVPVPRSAAPSRKGPVVRPPARPHPLQRGPSKSPQCLHIHFHPTHKRDLALPPPRPSKETKGQQVPPFPPPRGVSKPPSRHVHWAPAQAPLPTTPYPYPPNASSRAHSQPHPRQYQSSPVIPRYQTPGPKHGPPQLTYRSG